MMKVILLALFGSCAAFAPAMSLRPAAMTVRQSAALRVVPSMEIKPQDTWWGDKDYPSSVVLGIGKNVPSAIYAPASLVALALGVYCNVQSNLVNILSGSTVNGFLVFGAMILPIYSWGLHVACWIQKQNGK